MTTPQAYQNAYKAADPRDDEDSRETDRRALISCAGRLMSAAADGGKNWEYYVDAIRHNQRLWTIFQVALCEPENPLPKHLKVILLNLSKYIDRTSFRAITQFAPDLLTSLADINRTVAKGMESKKSTTTDSFANAPLQPPQTPTGSVTTSA